MKFFTDNRAITTTRVDQVTTRKCYNVSLEVAQKKKEESRNCPRLSCSSKVMMIDFDA